MKKIFIALVALTMILSAVIPSAMALPPGPEYIDQSTGWEAAWDAKAQVVLGGAGDSTGPSGGTGGFDAPEIHFAWVWPDEDTTVSGTQVKCVPSNFTEDVEVKIVISDPNGLDDIEDVKAQIIYPVNIWPWCGCPKFKVSAQREENCNVIENQAFLAKQAGLITAEEYDDIIYNICDQPNWALYIAYFDMWYCEPAGYYDVLVWGVDNAFQVGDVYSIGSDLSGSDEFGFEFVEALVLEYDFYEVNYGNIRPSVIKYIQGDDDLSTPENPTVKNEGNVPIKIRIKSTPLFFQGTQYEIDEFDFKFKGEVRTYPADEWVTLSQYLCVCNIEKLDLSIHAREGLPQGFYTGQFYMQIYKGCWGGTCTP